MATNVTFGLTGLPGRVGDFIGQSDLSITLPLPTHLSGENLDTIKRDCELFAQKISAHPQEFISIVQYLHEGKMKEAGQIAKEIGLSEAEFQQSGGGLIWLLVAAIVAGGLLYSSDAW